MVKLTPLKVKLTPLKVKLTHLKAKLTPLKVKLTFLMVKLTPLKITLTINPFDILSCASPDVEQTADMLLIPLNRGEPHLTTVRELTTNLLN